MADRQTRASGPPRWIAIRPSSDAPPIWPPAIAASPPRRTTAPPRIAAYDASCCRDGGRSPLRDGRMNGKPGFGAANAGASAVKAASASSSGGTACVAVATMARTACSGGSGSASLPTTCSTSRPSSTREPPRSAHASDSSRRKPAWSKAGRSPHGHFFTGK